MTRIALITDLHISLDEQSFDVDTAANFKLILSHLSKWTIEHLIIAGDLCLNMPEYKVYLYIKPFLENLRIPYSIISGNHDNSKTISEIYEMTSNYYANEGELYFFKMIGERPFIFLDTNTGQMSDNQLLWLKSMLETHKKSNPMICMHYPPVIAGVPHIDANYGLNDLDKIQNIFHEFSRPIDIFVGHCHVEKFIRNKNMNVFITPSCFIQIDQQSKSFKPDHFHIAYRIIDFGKDWMNTGVHYIF